MVEGAVEVATVAELVQGAVVETHLVAVDLVEEFVTSGVTRDHVDLDTIASLLMSVRVNKVSV